MTDYNRNIKHAQRIATELEIAADDGKLIDWFDGSQITLIPDAINSKLDKAIAIFGDCPLCGIKFNIDDAIAYVFYGNATVKVPDRTVYELTEFFNMLHYC